MDDEEKLQHFGILGMHWGIHKPSQATIETLKKVTKSKTGKKIVKLIKTEQNIVKKGKEKTTNWVKEVGKLYVNDLKHPLITLKANYMSIGADTVGGVLKRTFLYSDTKTLQDVNNRVASRVKTGSYK